MDHIFRSHSLYHKMSPRLLGLHYLSLHLWWAHGCLSKSKNSTSGVHHDGPMGKILLWDVAVISQGCRVSQKSTLHFTWVHQHHCQQTHPLGDCLSGPSGKQDLSPHALASLQQNLWASFCQVSEAHQGSQLPWLSVYNSKAEYSYLHGCEAWPYNQPKCSSIQVCTYILWCQGHEH